MHTFLVYVPPLILLIVIAVFLWFDRLPSLTSIHGLAEIANTKGGIILLLYAMSLMFFFVGIRFGYWVISGSHEGKITVENGLVMAMFGFLTGSAFGGAFSAMLKTMTGDSTIGTVSKELTEKTTVTSAIDKV